MAAYGVPQGYLSNARGPVNNTYRDRSSEQQYSSNSGNPYGYVPSNYGGVQQPNSYNPQFSPDVQNRYVPPTMDGSTGAWSTQGMNYQLPAGFGPYNNNGYQMPYFNQNQGSPSGPGAGPMGGYGGGYGQQGNLIQQAQQFYNNMGNQGVSNPGLQGNQQALQNFQNYMSNYGLNSQSGGQNPFSFSQNSYNQGNSPYMPRFGYGNGWGNGNAQQQQQMSPYMPNFGGMQFYGLPNGNGQSQQMQQSMAPLPGLGAVSVNTGNNGGQQQTMPNLVDPTQQNNVGASGASSNVFAGGRQLGGGYNTLPGAARGAYMPTLNY